jgi:hypothetical protein
MQFKEKKMYPMVIGAGLFLLLVVGVVLFDAFASACKSDEDKAVVEKIKRQLVRL